MRGGLVTDEQVAAAAAAVRRGQVVAYPTETFYGLGVDALDERALAALMALKPRQPELTVSLLVADVAMAVSLAAEVPPLARAFMEAHWPGALTIALPARPGLPVPLVSEGYVAVRVSPHPVAARLVTALGRPLTTTSANPSGRPPARSAPEVIAYFGDRCPVLDGGPTPGGLPSTLIRVRGDDYEILRAGAVDIGSGH